MANNENKTNEASKAVEAVEDNRVEVFVPKGYANDEPNLFVSVNGVNYLLPKGKKSLVPAHVAAEFERSKRAQERLDENIEQMLEASR